MARNGQKSGGRDFKPGVSGNPNGRPKAPEGYFEVKKMNRQEMEMLTYYYWTLPINELELKFKDPETPARDKLIIRVVIEGIKKGDSHVMGFLTDFVFGAKPKELKIDNPNPPAQVVVMLPSKNE